MNLFERIKIELLYCKLFWIGDKRVDKKGWAIIPCKKCGKLFRAYSHYDSDFGMCIDNECKKCWQAGEDAEESEIGLI